MTAYTISELRTNVQDALVAAGINAQDYLTERIVPPVAIVIPGDPYISIEPEETKFGEYRVNLDILVIGAKGTNRKAAESADDLIQSVIQALEDDWDVREVSQPNEITIGNSSHIGAVVTVHIDTKIKEVI